jgi:hypothetical protein
VRYAKEILQTRYFCEQADVKEGILSNGYETRYVDRSSYQNMKDKLATLGSPISEEDQMVTLLGNLPQDFERW